MMNSAIITVFVHTIQILSRLRIHSQNQDANHLGHRVTTANTKTVYVWSSNI
jgi:hypothetical protein